MDASKAGVYNIRYNVTDVTGNKAVEAIRRVEVSSQPDTKAPVVSLNGEERVVIEIGSMYQDAGVTAIDDRDGDLTDKVSFLAGSLFTVLTMG